MFNFDFIQDAWGSIGKDTIFGNGNCTAGVIGVKLMESNLSRDVWPAGGIYWVVVSSSYYCHPYLGKIPILINTFQMGLNPPTS